MSYPLKLDTLPAELKFSPDSCFCMELNGLIAAYGQLSQRTDGRGHLSKLIVAPQFRGQGNGKKLVLELLILAVEKGFEPMGLYVEPANEVAVNLYRSLGFVRTDPPAYVAPSPGSWYFVR